MPDDGADLWALWRGLGQRVQLGQDLAGAVVGVKSVGGLTAGGPQVEGVPEDQADLLAAAVHRCHHALYLVGIKERLTSEWR